MLHQADPAIVILDLLPSNDNKPKITTFLPDESAHDAAGVAVAYSGEGVDERVGDVPGPLRVPVRGVVDAVGDEPAVPDGGGPVVDSHGRVAGAGLQHGRVPCLHVGLGVRAGADPSLHVDPQHRLTAEKGHHLVDPADAVQRGADEDIGSVVGPQGEHPAAAHPAAK